MDKIKLSNIVKQYHKSGKMKEILEKIKEKGMFSELMLRADASRTTVNRTFENESFDSLKGKEITVYREAVALLEEINNLPARAAEALSQQS